MARVEFPRKSDRRQLFGRLGGLLGGSAARSAEAQRPVTSNDRRPPGAAAVRLVPRAELVNTLEYEAQARRVLPPATYSLIADGDDGSRSAFNRITLRPRLLTPVLDLDISVSLFGDSYFAPIFVGPMANQQQFHAEGEFATLKGATAAQAVMIVASRSSIPLDRLITQATAPFWYQVFATDPSARTEIQTAVKAGCKAVVVTVGAASPAPGARAVTTTAPVNWTTVAALRKGVNVPVIVKGITTPQSAALALQHGVDGIVVSSYGRPARAGQPTSLFALPQIVDAVGGKVPVLVDGSFRRGTDMLKALAFGARGVLVGRPVMWGLSAYGADGVQGVVEMLQTEVARYTGMCGRSNLQALDRTVLNVHEAPWE
jgi:4-hydroxymandelate oxidase